MKKVLLHPIVHSVAAWGTIILLFAKVVKYLNSIFELEIVLEYSQYDIFLLCLISTAIIFSIHAYVLAKNNKKTIVDNYAQLSGVCFTSCRCMACIYKGDPDIAYIWWLRAAQFSNETNDNKMTRSAMVDSLNELKKVNSILPGEVEEVYAILNTINGNSFKSEINSFINEIERLTIRQQS